MEQTFVDTTAGIRALPMLELQQRQLQEQSRYRQDIARERAEQNRIRRDQVAAQFGPYAVMGPDGELDIQGSARAQQAAAQAAKLGEAEALSGQSFADIPEDIRGLPEYRQGWASGMATRAMEEDRFGRQAALLEQRGQTAEEVARIRNENAQLRSLMGGDLAEIVEEVPGVGKVSRKVRSEDLPKIRAAAIQEREDKPILDEIKNLKAALREIETTEGNKVSIGFQPGMPPTVKKGGFMGFGGVPKAEARKEVRDRIRNLQGLLGRTVGEQEDERPTGQVPANAMPGGTNAPVTMFGFPVDASTQQRVIPSPAAAGIVQPRGTNIFNAVRDPSGGWIIGRPGMTY